MADSRPVHAADLARAGLPQAAGREEAQTATAAAGGGGAAAAEEGQKLTPPSDDDDGTSTVYYHSAASSFGGEASAPGEAGAGAAGSGARSGSSAIAPLSKIQTQHRQQQYRGDGEREAVQLQPRSSSSLEQQSSRSRDPGEQSGASTSSNSQDREARQQRDIDATKQDYFSRHPDMDANFRGGLSSGQGHASSSRNQRSRNRAGSSAAATQENSSQSESEADGGNHSSTGGGGLFSPALSTGTTLSAGVSLGATMGGSERIFPIRSVVKSATSKRTANSRDASQPYSPTGSAGSSSGAQGLCDGYFPATSAFSGSQGRRSGHPGDDSDGEEDDEGIPESYNHPTYGHEYSRRSPIPDDTSDFSFPIKPTVKPDYTRQDSGNSAPDSANSGPTTIGAPSYPTTSQHSSDDSDPTARRNSSTTYTPTTAHSRKAMSESSSRQPGLARIDSTNAEPDIIKLAKDAYDAGEAEEGPSVESGHLGSIARDKDGLYLTVRFEHQETGDGHAILTGRKGELLKCEDEPIHIPGAIQDFGVLLAIEEDDAGNFVVVQVSEVYHSAVCQSYNC